MRVPQVSGRTCRRSLQATEEHPGERQHRWLPKQLSRYAKMTLPPKGAAVWLGPDAWEITPARAAAAGLDTLPTVMGEAAAARFFSALAAIEPLHHRDVPAGHWYVLVVGVSPAAQGGGLGRALLQPVMDRADAAAQPCYLETAQPNNVPFYQHLGFRQIVETREPKSGLRLWTFRRDPPTAVQPPREPGSSGPREYRNGVD